MRYVDGSGRIFNLNYHDPASWEPIMRGRLEALMFSEEFIEQYCSDLLASVEDPWKGGEDL